MQKYVSYAPLLDAYNEASDIVAFSSIVLDEVGSTVN